MRHYHFTKVLYITMVSVFITTGLVIGIYSQANSAEALGLPVLVGGVFLPAIPPLGYDIFTPSVCNGAPVLLVTVIGVKPGTFVFAPPATQIALEHFLETPNHSFNNALGYAVQDLPPPCPPTLHIIGSSLTPGF